MIINQSIDEDVVTSKCSNDLYFFLTWFKLVLVTLKMQRWSDLNTKSTMSQPQNMASIQW